MSDGKEVTSSAEILSDVPECPWCGHEEPDEVFDGDEVLCDVCNRLYSVDVVEVSMYESTKIEAAT